MVIIFDANFTATPVRGDGPLVIQFTDTSTGFGIVRRTWDFGDGSLSSLQNPVHIYKRLGDYTVTLRITGISGATSTERKPGFVMVTKSAPLVENKIKFMAQAKMFAMAFNSKK